MQGRTSSQRKLASSIMMKQTELMSKLALAAEPKRYTPTDELGFAMGGGEAEPDALQDLISKSKTIVPL